MHEINELKTKLLAAYQSLPFKQQRIINLCAMIGLAPSKQDLLRAIKTLSLSNESKKKLTDAEIKAILNTIEKTQLLDGQGNCHPLVLHDIAAISLKEQAAVGNQGLLKVGFLYFTADHFKLDYYGSYQIKHKQRSVHIAMHSNDIQFFTHIKIQLFDYPAFFLATLIELTQTTLLDIDWVSTRHPVIQFYLVCAKFAFCYSDHSAIPPDIEHWLAFLKTFTPHEDFKQHPFLISKLQQIFMHNGLLDQCDAFANLDTSSFAYYETLAMNSFLKGDFVGTVKYYDSAIKLFN